MQYLREIIFLLGDDRSKLPWLVLLFIFASIFDLAGLTVIGPYVSIMVDSEQFFNSVIGNTLVQMGFPTEKKDILLILGIALIGIFLLKAIMSIFINWVIQRFIMIRDIKMRSYLMHTYQELPYSEYINRNSSDYIHTINTRVGNFSGGVLLPWMKMSSEGIIGIAVLSLLAWTNVHILSLLILFVGLTAIIYLKASKQRIILYGERSDSSYLGMVQGIQEGIDGLKEIRILGVTSYFYNKVADAAKKAGINGLKATLINTIPRYLLEFTIILFIVLIVIISSAIGDNVSTLVSILGVYGVASLRLAPMANLMITGISQLRYNRAPTANLYKDLKDLNSPKKTSIINLTQNNKLEFFNRLDLQNVCFSYSNTSEQKWILKNLSFTIKNGDSIGIIGASGVGKTTLIDVLLGLLQPQEGDIFFNNRSLKTMLPMWRAQVAYLPQEIFLIDNTLQCNVALGVSDDKIEHEKVMNALHQARLTDLVDQLPNGLDTMIGEHGVRLSGGQKQRVALARAFYHDRNVLVLDEATSSLDHETEQEIVEEIRLLKGEKTLIVIAHRLTTLQHCDRIYRLDQGQIIESGTSENMNGENENEIS